jgi:hypothetical protein
MHENVKRYYYIYMFVQPVFLKNLYFFMKINFFLCFNVLILKILFKKIKKILFIYILT